MDVESVRKITDSCVQFALEAYDALLNHYRYYSVHENLRWFLLDQPVVPVLLTAHALFASLNVYRLTKGRQFWRNKFV